MTPPEPSSSDAPQGGGTPRPPAAEWAVAALGVLLVVAALGVLVRDATDGPPRPPDVVVRVDSVVPGGSGFTVHFRAENAGEETAADVTVRGELAAPGARATEVGEARIDYVPGHSTRGGGLVFRGDPRAGALTLRVTSYETP